MNYLIRTNFQASISPNKAETPCIWRNKGWLFPQMPNKVRCCGAYILTRRMTRARSRSRGGMSSTRRASSMRSPSPMPQPSTNSRDRRVPVRLPPDVMSHYIMLQRNLCYTAITRSRRVCILIVQRRAVSIAVGNAAVEERGSHLMECVREED